MDLIPGLPDDIALECLIRLPIDQFSNAASVCSNWKGEIKLPEFRQRRKDSGLTRPVFALAQAVVTTTTKPHGVTSLSSSQIYRISVCDPDKGFSYDLPPIPEMLDGLPVFSRVVGVGSELIVIGGCDPVSWRVFDSVFIYSFVSGSWRRGSDMPGGQRLFFGCASDSERMVLIAGGHDDEKNALKSALVYDVVEDAWVVLPDMVRERDESKCVFHHGKFHVVGGYPTQEQGHFHESAEIYDFATAQWCLKDNFLDADTCPESLAGGDDGKIYMCREGDVVLKNDSTWQREAKLPAEISNVAFVTAWQGKVLAVGNSGFDGLHSFYVLDTAARDGNAKKWRKVETSDEYSGHVQSGCCLEL